MRILERSRQLALLDELLRSCETALERLDPDDAAGAEIRGRTASARGELDRLRGMRPPLDDATRRRQRRDALATIGVRSR